MASTVYETEICVAHLTVYGRSVICGASWLDVDNSSNVLEVSGASNRPANFTDFANSFPTDRTLSSRFSPLINRHKIANIWREINLQPS